MFIERQGVRLYIDVQGEGSTSLIFVHGWLSNADIWNYQVEEYRKDYQVVTLDLRGFGRSDKPKVEYTFHLFAEDIDYLIKDLRISKPIFIGWSKGASVGILYAASHPECLSKLVLVGGGAKFINGADYPYGLEPEEIYEIAEYMKKDYKKAVWDFLNSEIPEPGMHDVKEWLLNAAMQTPPDVAINSILNDMKYDLRPLLEKIRVPILICYGELDSICPPGNSIYLKSKIPQAEIYEFKGLGHIPFLTEPTSFNTCLSKFLTKNV